LTISNSSQLSRARNTKAPTTPTQQSQRSKMANSTGSRLSPSTVPRRKLVDYTQRGKCIPQHDNYASASATSMCTLLEGRKNSKIKVPSDLPSMLNVSFHSFDTCGLTIDKDEPVEEEQQESIDFFLKIPSSSVRRERKFSTGNSSDSLRERFQQQPVKLVNRKLIETILNEPSTRSQRSHRRTRSNAAA
jgi:hypothetical protein